MTCQACDVRESSVRSPRRGDLNGAWAQVGAHLFEKVFVKALRAGGRKRGPQPTTPQLLLGDRGHSTLPKGPPRPVKLTPPGTPRAPRRATARRAARCTPGRACARKRPHRSPSLRARLGLWASATQIRPRAAADLNNQFGFHGEKIHHHNRRGRQPRSREKKVWERGATSSRPRPWRCSGPSSCRPQPRPPMTKTYAGRPSRCLHSMRPAFAAMGSRTQK